MGDGTLMAAYAAALRPEARDQLVGLPDLATRLEQLVDAARTAWPALDVPAVEFAAYLAERVPPPALGELGRGAELYLTCACRRGNEAAIASFQRTYFSEIDAAARRAGAGQAVAADARQNLALGMFTGASPAVGGYSGRGDLRGWIRVCATREVLRLLEKGKLETPIASQSFLDALAPASDPELAFLKDRYHQEFAEAFHEAVAVLSDRERTLLHQQLIDRWTIDDFAAHHGVHRVTASRWLQAARATILEETRARLKARWGATTVEVDSVIRLLSSRLDLSIERAIRGE